MESQFVYTILAVHLIAYFYLTFQITYSYVEKFGDDTDKIADYKKQQGNLISIINIYNRSEIIRTSYSNNTNIISALDTFRSTVDPIWNNINSIRNAWVKYSDQTNRVPVYILKELDKQYLELNSLKSTISTCVVLIKSMRDYGMSDSYRA